MIKIVLPLAATAGLLGAAPAPAPEITLGQTRGAQLSAGACDHTIQLVREQTGMPKLERGTASPDAPLFIAAVDKRIDNCRVLVMANDYRDIRPEPALREGAPLLQPAR